MHRRLGFAVMFVLLLASTSALNWRVSAECADRKNSYPSHLVSEYENITVHEGDLVIDGAKTFTIENCTFIQSGNISVRDHAKLRVCNAIFNVSTETIDRRHLWVQDYAELEIRNARITFPLSVFDHAKVSINNSMFGAWGIHFTGDSSTEMSNSFVSEMGVSDHSKVTIENGEVNGVFLYVPPNSTVSLSNLRPRFFSFWNLHQTQPLFNVAYDLTLINTRMNDWEGWSVSIDHRSKVTISNSTFNLEIGFSQTTAELKDLTEGFHQHWTNGMITLENYTLNMGVGIHLNEVSFTVMNSTAFIFASGLTNICINHSRIDHLAYDNGVGTICSEKTAFAWARFLNSSLFLSGDIVSTKRPDIWLSSNVTRNYSIVIADKSGIPIEKTEVNLSDKNDDAIWVGSTDSLGNVDFNLTFSDNNYTDWSRLNVYKEGFYNFTRSISFFSDTPIIINLTEKPAGDVNEDYKVNILDISLVAYSFGCKPADSRWNDTCDLNNDGEINILDISMVAKDYGKSV